jgi:hypothetical protein
MNRGYLWAGGRRTLSCARSSRLRCATAGSRRYLACYSHTKRIPKSRIAPGSPQEYKQLFEATRDRVQNPRKKKENYDDLHDYVLFMVNTGLRPDESSRIEFRDVKVVDEDSSGQRILEIDVRASAALDPAKSMPGACTRPAYDEAA